MADQSCLARRAFTDCIKCGVIFMYEMTWQIIFRAMEKEGIKYPSPRLQSDLHAVAGLEELRVSKPPHAVKYESGRDLPFLAVPLREFHGVITTYAAAAAPSLNLSAL